MLAVVKNFTIGTDTTTGAVTATFDAYYGESLSVPVTLTGAKAILQFLHQAGLLAAPDVNDVPVLLDGTTNPPTFVRAANI